MMFSVSLINNVWPRVRFVDMQDDWAELTEIEARVTAQDRLDLHFEHRDALDVERGSWRLIDYLGRFRELRVRVGDHSVRGEIVTVGPDWVQLATALVAVDACELVVPQGSGRPTSTVLQFRQAVRQLAGRVPREVILRNGQSQVMTIDWVANDFMQVRIDAHPMLVPLRQVAVVFGRPEIG